MTRQVLEVDLVVENGPDLIAVEMRAGRTAPSDAQCRLDDRLNGTAHVGLPWPSILAFVRLAGNPVVVRAPVTPGERSRLDTSPRPIPSTRARPRHPARCQTGDRARSPRRATSRVVYQRRYRPSDGIARQ